MKNLILCSLSRLIGENFKQAELEFGAEDPKAGETINMFKQLKNRNQLTGNSSDINWWRKQGWDKFKSFVDTEQQRVTRTQEKRKKNPGKSIVLDELSDWLIVIPLDKFSSCYHGKHTDWCTSKPDVNYFEQYFYGEDTVMIYFLQLSTGRKWAAGCRIGRTGPQAQCFDQDNKRISAEQFNQQTQLDLIHYRDLALGEKYKQQIDQARNQYSNLVQELKQQIPWLKERSEEMEEKLWRVKDLFLMIRYCVKFDFRWDKLERLLISVDWKTYYNMIWNYIHFVVKDRWIALERKLLTEPVDEILTQTAKIYKTALGLESWPEFDSRI